MNKRESDKIKLAIQMCEVKIQKLAPYIKDNKPALNQEYNRLLIEKAVLKDKLKNKKVPLFEKLARKIFKREKTLICDYFKASV